jgi:hypothetical protein
MHLIDFFKKELNYVCEICNTAKFEKKKSCPEFNYCFNCTKVICPNCYKKHKKEHKYIVPIYEMHLKNLHSPQKLLSDNIVPNQLETVPDLPQNNNENSNNNILHFSSSGKNSTNDDSLYHQGLNQSNNIYKGMAEYFIYTDKMVEEEDIQFNKMEIKEDFFTHINEKCKDSDEEDNKKNEIELKCSDCKINKAVNICSHCRALYCEGCSSVIEEYKEYSNHILNKIPDNLLKLGEIKEKFLNIFISFIKHYLMKTNFLLKSKTIYELPLIEDVNKLELHQQYLQYKSLLYMIKKIFFAF